MSKHILEQKSWNISFVLVLVLYLHWLWNNKSLKLGVLIKLEINIPFLWKKNSMLNISRSTHSKDLIFGIHVDILTNFQLSGKNLQLEPLGKKYSNLIEELAPKIMSSSLLSSTFGLTQATKSISGGIKYHKF